MNYPRFTKVISDYFMTRKPSISRRNRIHWHYVQDDALFSTIKVVSRHQATQQYGAILPIELTTAEIRNSEGTGSKPGVLDMPSDDSEEELSWKSFDNEEVESARDVYSKQRIIAVIELQIMEWHDYKHLDWISPDTYRTDLRRCEAYTAYSNLRGFIYQNKDKKNILMRIDELHKFSDGTLNDVRNALDDRLKGIRMHDYAGASLDRKSTTGGCQFLGSRLLSWQCKKQTIVANSTTEAEYITFSNYYGQDVHCSGGLSDRTLC
nr:ribonuclease H-like domain, reverse transcriptase, RNA-dependent DNA polymerase [Tanacetum cinerariifolium]